MFKINLANLGPSWNPAQREKLDRYISRRGDIVHGNANFNDFSAARDWNANNPAAQHRPVKMRSELVDFHALINALHLALP
jgi:hypothetical protein